LYNMDAEGSVKINTPEQKFNSVLPGRIASVDFFRGFTMFMLAGEASHLYSTLLQYKSGVIHFIGTQLEHHEWHGLHFWDLIQPFFMFIVGVAIPFAVANRLKKGATNRQITIHAIKRSLLLLFIGWALYFIEAGHFVLRLQNVLAQLSVTYLAAFLKGKNPDTDYSRRCCPCNRICSGFAEYYTYNKEDCNIIFCICQRGMDNTGSVFQLLAD
jgi:predicted acyltransferase